MYDSGFTDRINEIVERVGGVGKACDLAGITYPTLSRWKDGTSDPKLSNIKAFAEAAGVSTDWLIFGREVGTSPNSSELTSSSNARNEPVTIYEDDYVLIPVYDIEASAGHGRFTFDNAEVDKHLAFRKRWIQARGLSPMSLAALFTKGDSMTPTIPESAAIVIDRARTEVFDGKIYVLRIDDRLYVKRTQWIPHGGLRLISDNRAYDSFDIIADDFRAHNIEVCGQVIHTSYDLPD